MFVFLVLGILESGSAFFHMNLQRFFEAELFFQHECLFFCFRHFGKRFRGVFSYEFIRFFEKELFFSMKVFVFWLQAFWKTVLCTFFI